MRTPAIRNGSLAALLAGCLLLAGSPVLADHESSNRLEFAPVAASPFAAAGEGTIEFHGGAEPVSRWTVAFQFEGLAPETDYTVFVQGRFGEDGSPEATAFTPLCAFRADAVGAGGCWNYLFGLRRANVLQLRATGEMEAVLQATRDPAGPGAITRAPNRFSPPAATPSAPPMASPVSA